MKLPLLLAIGTVATRIWGEAAIADGLAMVYLALITASAYLRPLLAAERG